MVLTFLLLVLWPLPMHGAAGVFGKGGFTTWVALEIVWALLGGIVIIVLPVWETVRAFVQAKKNVESIAEKADASATLKNGMTLTIDITAEKQAAAKATSNTVDI